MNEDLVVLVPVLGRPHRVKPTLDGFSTTVPGARILFIASPGDEDELDALKSADVDTLIVDGNYATKINTGVEATTEAHILMGADDLLPHPGWYETACEFFKDGIGVVGTQDLGNRRVLNGSHSTHPLIARWYVPYGTPDGDQLLHTAYRHNYCDRELVDVAKRRNAWAFANDAVIEHLHPLWGKAEQDEIYDLGHEGFFQDRALFRSRNKLYRGLQWASQS